MAGREKSNQEEKKTFPGLPMRKHNGIPTANHGAGKQTNHLATPSYLWEEEKSMGQQGQEKVVIHPCGRNIRQFRINCPRRNILY